MIRAFFTALFVLMFVRFAVWAAHVLTRGRRGEEIPSGPGTDRRFEDGAGGTPRRRASRRVAPGEVVDVPFTEVPPPEPTKRM
ncbi:MAG TPA: hypothetical protein VFP58_13215 [Candidatus Eisenbacteria bacterium]|nr:hypothetical protein [Candidatus Eisenbacteria bacterium]